jgi:hypothetical protein
MTRAEHAEDLVVALLKGIDDHKWRDAFVPHGFDVASTDVAERRTPFAPSLVHHEVTVELKVPLIYSIDSSSGVACGVLPPDTDNLECLRDWIDGLARLADEPCALDRWVVEPADFPDPRDSRGCAPTADEHWTVTARFSVN